ncbi:tellurite resistance TerB family protein [Roseomonas sp. OT10]|uniref:tellurite resistance TerB family protein n=1 Tax=Roseomonas cutis TaxID=2897332 RepID=UPI001E514548|nr:tellurite resistance TerB family protein [Roseomonas sp. OT10]UFN51283.1 tellurite resistance TerB family protein [Roseomonas sp. OT10]
MIDAKALLDSFLGNRAGAASGQSGGVPATGPWSRPDAPPVPAQAGGQGGSPWTNPAAAAGSTLSVGGLAETAKQVLGQATRGGMGGFAGGAAAGGLLGAVLGGKKFRKMGGGVLSHGGAALLGALAHRAYQNWQQGQTPAQSAPPAPQEVAQVEPRYLPEAAPAADGQPFELALVRAMIGAAKADGHIDAEEQRAIFAKVEAMGLDAEAKGFVFDALAKPMGVAEVAASARTPEQASELYLVSRLAVDPDEPAERAYLEALAHRLKLPEGLVAHLDQQVTAAQRGAT